MKFQTCNEDKPIRKSTGRQVILGLLTNFSNIAPSMSLGYSAITQPIIGLNDDEFSWFASSASLATPFGCLLAGPVADRYGRRAALFATNIICIIGWLLIAVSDFTKQRFIMLIIGRIFTGFSTGLSSMPANIYMAEVATSRLRSVFCTWNTIAFSLGILVIYGLGAILQDNWQLIAGITVILPCCAILLIYYAVPESPTWLVGQGRFDEATKSLCRIYGIKSVAEPIRNELETLIGSSKDSGQSTWLSLFKSSALKPLGLVIAYFAFQQFSGTFVIVFYALDIIRDAGITFDGYVVLVLIGVVRFMASVIVSVLSRIIGRRPLTIISGCGMTVSMLVLSLYVRLSHDAIDAIPIVALLLYFLTSTLGFLPLPFALAAEVFPADIRGTAAGLSTFFAYICNFITVKTYGDCVRLLGRDGVFLFYGGVALSGMMILAVILPETRGKTLDEIGRHFNSAPADSAEVESAD